LISGHATYEGTARYAGRFAGNLPGHFRDALGLRISSLGIGTYLGDPSAEVDALYQEAVGQALENGINVVDTAVNYRHQRSERAIGQALAAAIAGGRVRRDEVVIATKGGFLTFDQNEPEDPSAYFQETLIDPGVVRLEEVVAGCHVIAPRYLENQIARSRHNLGVDTLDIYYIHNPETQLPHISRGEFDRRIRAAFAALEKAVAGGAIRLYGTATWNGYRVKPGSPEALSLPDLLRAAEEVGGNDHHFRALQLPFNLAMPEALAASTQQLDGRAVPLLQVARGRGMLVFASASLLQRQLTEGLPENLHKGFPGIQTDAQRALQFVRSTPGITCALVGMSHREHVKENLATAERPPLNLEQFRALFGK